MSKHLLLTKYDISPAWHDEYPDIMGSFCASFTKPVRVGGEFAGIGEDGRPNIGYITAVEKRGDDLWGEIGWISDPPVNRYVRMNWAIGGSGAGNPPAATLTSGFVDHWPHLTAWEEDEPENMVLIFPPDIEDVSDWEIDE